MFQDSNLSESISSKFSKLVYHHCDFSALLREADVCSIDETEEVQSQQDDYKQKVKRLKYQHNFDDIKTEEVLTSDLVMSEIKREGEMLGVPIETASCTFLINQLKLIISQHNAEEDLTKELQSFESLVNVLKSHKILSRAEISGRLIQESSLLHLPLYALWKITITGVLSFEQILKRAKSEEDIKSLLDDLLVLILPGKKLDCSPKIITFAITTLIVIGYDLNEPEFSNLQKLARNSLVTLSTNLFDFILSEEKGNINNNKPNEIKENKNETDDSSSGLVNMYDLLIHDLSFMITADTLGRYFSNQLEQLLTHNPSIQLVQVLKNQHKWRSTLTNKQLKSHMVKLIAGIGHVKALSILDDIVTTQEVNWGCVLTLVAAALNVTSNATGVIKEMIEKYIRQGCQEFETEMLVLGFLFARHASQEGRHIFPSYSQWFASMFASESVSPASNKQAFIFLIKFLNELVPHESTQVLRAHSVTIYYPPGCHDVLKDFSYLVRTRLRDLDKDTPVTIGSSRVSHVTDAKLVEEEVESAVTQFRQTGKIPKFVIEVSTFRQPFYIRSFLPVLLSPRPFPDTPDPRMKLIDALHASNKIPTTTYKNYVDLCQKESANLISGIFMEDDEEIKEPLCELQKLLEELITQTSLSESSANNSVLNKLSEISHKVETMMSFADAKFISISSLVINCKQYNGKLLTYQIIEKFLSIIEQRCMEGIENNPTYTNRPPWLSQFVSLFATSLALQSALFTYLLNQLKVDTNTLLLHHSKIYAIVLSEISKIDGIFLPIKERGFDKAVSSSTFYVRELPLTTVHGCYFSCCLISDWLQWHMKNHCTDTKTFSDVPLDLISIYCCLAPRLNIMDLSNVQNLVFSQCSTYSSYISRTNGILQCSNMFYENESIKLKKQSIEYWLNFELNATWGDTDLDVKQNYLERRIIEKFVATENINSLHKIIIEIFWCLVNGDRNKENASILLLLLQSLSVQCHNSQICLLNEFKCNERPKCPPSQIMRFMTLCRSLPPSLFINGSMLLHAAPVLEELIIMLRECSAEIELSVSNTVFLLSAIIKTGYDTSVTNLQLERCLKFLRTNIVYHWPGVNWIFKENFQIIKKYSCLESLWNTMNRDPVNCTELSTVEVSLYYFSQVITDTNTSKIVHGPYSLHVGIHLLRHIGIQQFNGTIPWFSGLNDSENISENNKKLISLTSQIIHLNTKKYDGATTMLGILFSPKTKLHNINTFSEKMFPFAVVLILSKLSTMMSTNLFAPLLTVLVYCYVALCEAFEKSDLDESSEKLAKQNSSNLSKKLSTDQILSQEFCILSINYLLKLSEIIFSHASKIDKTIASGIPKLLLSKCDPEMRAIFENKL